MNQACSIVERYFGHRGNELLIGGVPVSEIVNLYGTPLFIYDCGVLQRKLELLRRALPAGFKIYYAIKANPNQTILRYFISQGCGVEIASGGELHQAIAAGCSPDLILFAGPGKARSELELALEQGIGQIHVESLQEIDRIVEIARRLGVQARIAIRVNPDEEAQGGAVRMGGNPSPFGVDEELLDAVLERVLTEQVIDFRGVHLFTGSQILDYKMLLRQYGKALEIAKCAASKAMMSIHMVNFGGGFGIPYFAHESELDITQFGRELRPLILEAKNRPEFERTTFMVEPGRFLVGEGGIYVTRINTVKRSRGKTFLVVDGGMNHHLAASGNLGQVVKRNFPVALLDKLDEPPRQTVDIVGPLCTPLDVLAREINLPLAEVGDLVGVFQSGAYARAASPLSFLSHPSPPEVWVNDGEITLIRRRGSYEDIFNDLPSGSSDAYQGN